MMKRVVQALGITLWMVAVGGSAATVVATHAVYAEFAQIVGGDTIDVISIIPSGFCPSHYDLSPSDLAAVVDASVILYSGFETWIETLSSAAGSAATVAQLPGAWNTPTDAISKVEFIRGLLSERFPDQAKIFASNAAIFIGQLQQASETLQDQAVALNASSVAVVCMEWQASFVAWLGFNVAVTYGIPTDLSLRDLVDLAAVGKEVGAQLVIDNLQSGVDFGAKLARELDAIHVILSNFPGAMPGSATVVDLFIRNAESLFSAIEPLE